MAIQHSKTIESLQVLNSGSNDIVSKVKVIFTSYDDSDQAGTTIESDDRFDINTDGVSNTDSGRWPLQI